MDVHGPHCGWSMRQASAMLLVPDSSVDLDIIYIPGNIMEFCHCRKVGTLSVPTERLCL